MKPYWQDESVTLYLGDCIEILAKTDAASIDAIVTDPPYGLEFMGKEWDGADGFRRSLNPADAERDSVFGRTSRTSPEYSTSKARLRTRVDGRTNPREGKSTVTVPESYTTGQGWKHGFAKTGYSDSKRMPRPNFGSSRNPVCTACHKHQRGTDRCLCSEPEFDERPADSNNLYQEWCTAWAAACLRVLKPGGHMLAFGGTRTWHRLACAIEDAGFEIRDSVADLTGYDAANLLWVYGSGFPKSANAARAIDRLMAPGETDPPVSEEGSTWEGWGTALKPAHEPIIVARKPLAGTVAANVLEHGTGALNIDGCRVEPTGESRERKGEASQETRYADNGGTDFAALPGVRGGDPAGRWPPNVVLGPEAAAELDRQSGVLASGKLLPHHADNGKVAGTLGAFAGASGRESYGDSGGASRFFPVFRYEAKAPNHERPRTADGSAHPTVKPVDLMRWLVRLVTPPGGLVLDPFAGSGTTAEACIVHGFRCVLIEKDPASCELIRERLRKPIQPDMFGGAA